MAPGMEKGKPLVVVVPDVYVVRAEEREDRPLPEERADDEAKPGQTLVEALAAELGGAPDPWRHRSTSMSCRTCMWFVLKNEKIGRCRRNAPTMSGYPAVFSSDWCGEHKIDETKI